MSRLLLTAWMWSWALPAIAQDPKGLVYDPNPAVAQGQTSEVSLEDLDGDKTLLNGSKCRVISCQNESGSCIPAQHAVADENGDFLYEPDETSEVDPFAEVNSYFHLWRAAKYFETHLDVSWNCPCGTNALPVFLNYAFDQAEFSGFTGYVSNQCESFQCGSMLLGKGVAQDGTTHNFAYDGDVIYHEYTHGIIDERNGNLGVLFDAMGASFEPGAVREGGADYFAATIGGDPLIAESLAGIGFWPEAEALRSLDQFWQCPRDLTGNPHKDGRILGAALWDIRELLMSEISDALILQTLVDIGPEPTFAIVSESLLQRMSELEEDGVVNASQVQEVSQMLEHYGLTDCQRIVPLTEEEHIAYGGDPYLTIQAEKLAPVHFSVDIADDVNEVDFTLRTLTGIAGHTLYVRNNVPVEIRDQGDIVADAVLEVVDDQAILSDSMEYTLPRDGILYIAVKSNNIGEGSNWFGLSASLAPQDVTGGAGCAVSQYPREQASKTCLVFLLILGLALWRKRTLYHVR